MILKNFKYSYLSNLRLPDLLCVCSVVVQCFLGRHIEWLCVGFSVLVDELPENEQTNIRSS